VGRGRGENICRKEGKGRNGLAWHGGGKAYQAVHGGAQGKTAPAHQLFRIKTAHEIVQGECITMCCLTGVNIKSRRSGKLAMGLLTSGRVLCQGRISSTHGSIISVAQRLLALFCMARLRDYTAKESQHCGQSPPMLMLCYDHSMIWGWNTSCQDRRTIGDARIYAYCIL